MESDSNPPGPWQADSAPSYLLARNRPGTEVSGLLRAGRCHGGFRRALFGGIIPGRRGKLPVQVIICAPVPSYYGRK
ncbi:hypothetical protein GCM10011378_34170 [Hymenobacter glacieicola]|uniref:Uncharacterized protein n=1 Tax=Hymenobacter glacieicola TaxID=1562124 RepID=A0ABQ1X289_9BACT|nr:hypothetical protein GCM10011378_34170 [Hymenobacter glacieicola]